MRHRLVSAMLVIAAVAGPGVGSRAWAQAAGELVPFWLVRPAYPPIARSASVQGVVIVDVTVDSAGRVASAAITRDIPLLSAAALQAAEESGFICRRCSGPMSYRLTYAFGLTTSADELEAAGANVTPTASTLRILAAAPPINFSTGTVAAGRSSARVEHAEEQR